MMKTKKATTRSFYRWIYCNWGGVQYYSKKSMESGILRDTNQDYGQMQKRNTILESLNAVGC